MDTDLASPSPFAASETTTARGSTGARSTSLRLRRTTSDHALNPLRPSRLLDFCSLLETLLARTASEGGRFLLYTPSPHKRTMEIFPIPPPFAHIA